MRFTLLSVLALTACSSMNPITAMRLAATNPLTADPGQFAVLVELPDGVGVTPGSAMLALTVTTPEGAVIDATYRLTRSDGEVWRLTGDALNRLRQDQATAIALEDADPDGTSGSFSAGFQPCIIPPGPTAGASASVSMQIARGGPFLPLIEDAPLGDLYSTDDIAALAPCPEGARP